MKSILEFHILQNFAPSNLNRDDTGSPKDAIFGGVRRGRISSQSIKRAIRSDFKERNIVSEDFLAVRTKRLAAELVKRLGQHSHPEGVATKVVQLALGGLKLSTDDEQKTQYLVYFSNNEIERLANVIHNHWDNLAEAVGQEDSGKKKDKKAAKDAVSSDVIKALESVLDGGKAVDVALFGRMLADLPEKNQDAASQIAHAISTHKIEHNEDFYTAVDDLKPEDTAGADMLGTVEFNSACYYRYGVLDLHKLSQNLQNDTELLAQGIEAFLQAVIHAIPSGKQNSFAAHQMPSFVAFTVRQNTSPRNLANAFEKPIRPSSQKSLVEQSVSALGKEWEKQDTVFSGVGQATVINLTTENLEFKHVACTNTEDLVRQALAHAKDALEQ